MKKTLIVILGIGCIATVAYYCFLKNKKQSNEEDLLNTEKNTVASDEPSKTDFDISQLRNSVEMEKNESVESIKERHQEAAAEMKKSVDKIFNDSSEQRTTKNSEEISNLMDDIDNL